MYKRIHTPNSPLLPLTPLVQSSTKICLSPKDTRLRGKLRRSFTPITTGRFCFSPPSISPIRGNGVEFSTPSKKLNFNSISKSANASMKLLRSSAR